ncbi:hypothetical protein SNE40_008523 [Patella caerulea]|uniref:Uncharacterized protein n=1 Tax=Patella caerulea TaxID=87958 RepID=A0AAN8PZ60_PATCE
MSQIKRSCNFIILMIGLAIILWFVLDFDDSYFAKIEYDHQMARHPIYDTLQPTDVQMADVYTEEEIQEFLKLYSYYLYVKRSNFLDKFKNIQM